jgi:type IV secretory pathway TrbD component
MIKSDKEADVTWRMIILRSRQMVLLRGVMTTVIILTSKEYVEVIDADVTWRMIILRSCQMVLLRGVMTTVIILTSRSMLK